MFSSGSLSSFARRKNRIEGSRRRRTVDRNRTARIGVGCVGTAAVARRGSPVRGDGSSCDTVRSTVLRGAARSSGACGARTARTRIAGRSTRRGRAARARRRRAASRAARCRIHVGARRGIFAAAVGGSGGRDGRAEREERRATEATSRKQGRRRCLQSKRDAAKRAGGLARANVASTAGTRNEVVHGVIFSGSSSSTKSKRP
jgi:hypothetical protein